MKHASRFVAKRKDDNFYEKRKCSLAALNKFTYYAHRFLLYKAKYDLDAYWKSTLDSRFS